MSIIIDAHPEFISDSILTEALISDGLKLFEGFSDDIINLRNRGVMAGNLTNREQGVCRHG